MAELTKRSMVSAPHPSPHPYALAPCWRRVNILGETLAVPIPEGTADCYQISRWAALQSAQLSPLHHRDVYLRNYFNYRSSARVSQLISDLCGTGTVGASLETADGRYNEHIA